MKVAVKLRTFRAAKEKVESEIDKASILYVSVVQAIADRYGVYIVTGHCSDTWQLGEKDWEFKFTEDRCSRHERCAFKALQKLDDLASEIRIGPSNMERFNPK